MAEVSTAAALAVAVSAAAGSAVAMASGVATAAVGDIVAMAGARHGVPLEDGVAATTAILIDHWLEGPGASRAL
jgi:hypothetical protein